MVPLVVLLFALAGPMDLAYVHAQVHPAQPQDEQRALNPLPTVSSGEVTYSTHIFLAARDEEQSIDDNDDDNGDVFSVTDAAGSVTTLPDSIVPSDVTMASSNLPTTLVTETDASPTPTTGTTISTSETTTATSDRQTSSDSSSDSSIASGSGTGSGKTTETATGLLVTTILQNGTMTTKTLGSTTTNTRKYSTPTVDNASLGMKLSSSSPVGLLVLFAAAGLPLWW